jgi:hypothetical protein
MEETLAFAVVLGIAYAFAMKISSNTADRVMDKKGFIGAVFVGLFLGGFIIVNSRLLSSYIGGSASEVTFFGIVVIIIVVLVVIWYFRTQVASTARAGVRTTRTSKKVASKVRRK